MVIHSSQLKDVNSKSLSQILHLNFSNNFMTISLLLTIYPNNQ